MDKRTDRLLWLDAVKGVGILAIMRVHMVYSLEWIESICYMGAVAMFFIIAGITLKHTTDTSAAIKKKAMRLLLPYAFWSAVLLLIEHRNVLWHAVSILYAQTLIIPPDTQPSLTMIIGNGPMWFLPCMFTAFIWVYLAFKKYEYKYAIACLLIFMAAVTYYYCPIMLPWSINASFAMAALILLGYETKTLLMHTKPVWLALSLTAWILSYPVFAGSSLGAVVYYGQFGFLSFFTLAFAALCETYSLCAIFQLLEKTVITQCFAYIGQQSLRLMCIHLIIYVRLIDFLYRHTPQILEYKWLVLSIALSAILSINAFIGFCLKKIKWAKYV